MKTFAYIPYLDMARILASIAVVAIHVASMVMTNPNTTLDTWQAANIVNAFSRWSVPLFIMISGALFLNYTPPKSGDEFYKKRAVRLGLPLLTWSVVFFLWKALVEGVPVTIRFFVQTLVFDQPFLHLYFLFVIGWLYLITPSIQKIWQTLTLTQQVGVVVFGLMAGILWPPTRFVATFWVPFIGFYVAGGLLSQVKVSRSVTVLSLVLSCGCFTLVALGTDWLTHQIQATHNLFFYDFVRSPLVIMGSLLLFIALKGIGELYQTHLKQQAYLISTWAKLTLGIYIVHPLVLWGIHQSLSQQLSSYPAGVRLLFVTSAVYSITLVLIVILKRTPYLSKVV